MTYAKLPGLTWDGTVYENEEMGTLEALLPTGGWPTAHAPAMVELSLDAANSFKSSNI